MDENLHHDSVDCQKNVTAGLLINTTSLSPPDPLGWRAVRFLVIFGVHLALLWAVIGLVTHPEARMAAREILVSLLTPPPPEPVAPQPKPMPSPSRPVQQTLSQPVPVAIPIDTAPAPVAAEVVASAPAAVTDARFDAAYLSNPKTVYPIASRRLREEGTVRLRVKVSAGGTAESVEISQSSGFGRLDETARAAVERWRFIPARRGEEAIESWVIVPVRFSLQDR
jgi:protein TonB